MKWTSRDEQLTLSPSATSTIFFPVAGFMVGKVFPETESTNSLLMNSWKTQRNKVNQREEICHSAQKLEITTVYIPINILNIGPILVLIKTPSIPVAKTKGSKLYK
jgi:hypothetical protein